jgi:hypothetical protein
LPISIKTLHLQYNEKLQNAAQPFGAGAFFKMFAHPVFKM